MGKLVRSGKVGLFSFTILPNSNTFTKHVEEFIVTVETPTEKFETKTRGWNAAIKWVNRIIHNFEENNYESDRYY
jgi:hypothetical protein